MPHLKYLTGLSLMFLGFFLSYPAGAKQNESDAILQEESQDYFEKWLKQDAIYIITPEERATFLKLTTPEEKENFIEQFWYRRDPDPRSPTNEFKEEHYRRIAYAVERFSSGKPGWRTDRGRVYIIHGPPDQIEPHPSGGFYERPPWEGGGITVAFPFEIWRYRHLEGIGSDIELEFVDPAYSGEYRLALDAQEKDAFARVPSLGLTWDEMAGIASKEERGMRDISEYTRLKDRHFDRFATFNAVQRAPTIKYKDLQELVQVDVAYQELPFRVRQDYFELNDNQVLVPITLEVMNKDLTFVKEAEKRVARVAVYAIVTSITNRVITEFDDDMVNAFSEKQFQEALKGRSVYQKMIPLDKGMRYKIDLVVKDLNSGHLSVKREALVPPDFRGEKLKSSSVILSNFVRRLGDAPPEDQMFVLDDVWIHPSISRVFARSSPLGVYFQLYNVGIDQSRFEPSLVITYELLRENKMMARVTDNSANSIHYFSGRRVVLLRQFPTRDLPAGDYQVLINIYDQLKDQDLTLIEDFKIEPISQVTLR